MNQGLAQRKTVSNQLFMGEGLTGNCFWNTNPSNSVVGKMTLGKMVLGKELRDPLPASPPGYGQCWWNATVPVEKRVPVAFTNLSLTEQPDQVRPSNLDHAAEEWLKTVPGGNDPTKREGLLKIFYEQHSPKKENSLSEVPGC